MTSSQPVVTPNALNFTPDNKHCYAYSGAIAFPGGASENTIMEFNTNSEYLVGEWSMDYDEGENQNNGYAIYFNNQIVSKPNQRYADPEPMNPFVVKLIIPPFTAVKITVTPGADNSNTYSTRFTGKAYGMTDTGFQ